MLKKKGLNIEAAPCSVIMQFAYHSGILRVNKIRSIIARRTELKILSFKADLLQELDSLWE